MNSALKITRSTCCYCGVGCGMLIESAPDAAGVHRITGVRGDPDHPANFGRLCSKGATLHLTAQPQVYQQVRASHPELRHERSSPRRVVEWDTALDAVAQRFADIIRRNGPDAVGIGEFGWRTYEGAIGELSGNFQFANDATMQNGEHLVRRSFPHDDSGRFHPGNGTCTPSGALIKANGFRNWRRQNSAWSTSLKAASSQMAGHFCSMDLT